MNASLTGSGLFENPDLAWIAVVLTVGAGLLVGSYLNVVIRRVPRGESLSSPTSSCPGCGARIGARDNVPVLSWVLLRGKCRACGTRISIRYPLVEASTALLFLATLLRFGLQLGLAGFLYLAAIGIALFLIDLDVSRLPNRIVLPAYIVLPVVLGAASWVDGDWSALLRATIGGLILYVFYFVSMLVYPDGMGFGDVKLSGVLGFALAWLGWGPFVVGAFSAFLFGGLFAIALLVLRKADRKSGIPFGPWMLLGAVVGTGAGEMLWDAYLSLMF